MRGLSCKRLAGAGARQADGLYHGCYEYRWEDAAQDPSTHGRVFDCLRAVLIASGGEVAAGLADRLTAEGLEVRTLRPGPRDSLDGRF